MNHQWISTICFRSILYDRVAKLYRKIDGMSSFIVFNNVSAHCWESFRREYRIDPERHSRTADHRDLYLVMRNH